MLKSIIKQYFRDLWKNKFYSFLALFGIAVTIMIIMIAELKMETIWHPGGPEKNNENIMYLSNSQLIRNSGGRWISAVNLNLIERHFSELKNAKATGWSNDQNWTFAGENELESYLVKYVNKGYWDVLDFELIQGRFFSKDEVAGKVPVIIISENAAQELLGKTNALGEMLEYKNTNFKVIGVVKNVPETCNFSYAHMWVPYSLNNRTKGEIYEPGAYRVCFRLNDKADSDRLYSEIRDVEAQVQKECNEGTFFLNGPHDNISIYFAQSRDIKEFKGKNKEMALLFLRGFLLLLIPAINLIGLNYTRIQERAEELSIRKAFGASKLIILKQVIIENMLLAVIGAFIGLLLAIAGIYLLTDEIFLSDFSSRNISDINLHINIYTFLTCIFYSAVLSVLSGIIPAMKMTKLQPAEVLKGGEL